MEQRILKATAEDAGARLDAWLAGQLEGVSRSAAARLLEEGQVTCGGRSAAKNTRLQGDETVCVTLPDPEPVDVVPQNIPLDIVYEDEDVIVVNKPKGLVVHPAPGHPDGTLVNALLYHCGDSLSGIGGELRPGIVHRIDRDTSGLIIAAKNDYAHQKLSAQLQDHTLARTYECVVVGNLKEDSGTVDAPIGRHPVDRKKMAVVANGRSAVTHWEVIARYPGFTHVRCRLETGRTTRSGSTWPTWATRSWGIPSTGIKSLFPASKASACMLWGCGSSIPGQGSRWSSPAPCRRSSRLSWKSSGPGPDRGEPFGDRASGRKLCLLIVKS